MLIIVSGFAGSGKSTLAEALAVHFGLEFVHASDLLKKLKTQKVYEIDVKNTKAGSGFWESAKGKKYLQARQKDSSMDRALDKLLLEIAAKGNVVLDSWTMPWLCKKGFKIWLEVSAKERARRVARRDGFDEKKVLEKILERDKITTGIYKKLYGFEMGADKKVFGMIIGSDKKTSKEVFVAAVNAAKNYFLKNTAK
ncbi:MAG: cytidylate kinase family protein [archaeon]